MTIRTAIHDDIGARERILREATRLFAVHGYEGTSLRMIAEAVGMQKGSLVYHFSSKENIREAVLDSLVARWKDVLPQIVLAAASGENRFERTIAECTSFFLEDPNRARLLMRENLDHPDELLSRVAAQLEPWLELVANSIRQGQKEGSIYPDLDPMAYIWEVVLLTLSTVTMIDLAPGLLGEKKHDGDRLARELIRIARTSLFRQEPD